MIHYHQLPIDVIPGTSPPKFRWRQKVSTFDGVRWIECDGPLPASVEDAIVVLIGLVKQQAQEIEGLKRHNDQLSKKAEGSQQQTGKKVSRG